jgi:transcription-repair coupling factor (superfamily II helicase)
MPGASDASLTAKLAELAGIGDSDEHLERTRLNHDGRAAELDPLPSFDVPADRPVVTARDVASNVARSARGPTHVTGVAGGASALVVRALAQANKRRVVAATADADAARALAADVGFLLGAPDADTDEASGKVLLFLPNEASPYADVNPDRRGAELRLAALFHLAIDLPWSVLVLPIAALSRKVVPRADVLDHAELVAAEQEIDRDALTARLARMGYVRSPLVEDPGTFAVRGAVLDVWAPSSDAPVRIELYGDLVMSLKAFDADTQRTLHDVREVWIAPVREAILTPTNVERAKDRVRAACDAVDLPSTKARALVDDVTSGRPFFGSEGFLPAYTDLAPLASYLPEDAAFVLEDPAASTAALRDELGRAAADLAQKEREPHFPFSAFYETEASVASLLGERAVVALHRTGIEGEPADATSLERFEAVPADTASLATFDQSDLERAIKLARASHGKAVALDPLVRRVRAWQEAGLRVIVAARAETQVERLTTLLRHRDVRVKARLGAFDPAILDDSAAARDTALVVVGSLVRGVVAPTEGLALVTEEEIFGSRVHRRAARAQASTAKQRAFVEDLKSLAAGDFVVHVEHGIGRYLGLVHKEVSGLTVDLLAVEYASGDKLYLPVYRMNQVQKYSGGDGAPKLDRLGGQTFAKTKAKVAKNLRQMADELLRLYAERRAAVGVAVPPADDDYRAFAATFPFEETPDQARAIADVDTDLEAPRPMDRLVCGDVGFGKTEVAIRAAFRVASSGRQVAVLCPTTVLAQQHFLNFESRMTPSGIVVRVMSRFQGKAEQDEVSKRLRDGTVDVVVGTHRLLSKDVHWKRLGLLVVDEEQRFGVAHKERIKQLKTNLDVLTLSATPIPRTLQMAVTGLRDMSVITTPPVDRRAIRTIVMRHDEKVIREAALRELGRGGQVFYVYNRVEGLYERAARLGELLPSARIAVAHGQMAEHALEQTMLDFVDGRYDILCTTAIIESGLDIPRANTMIIDRADIFGLAQLYQLRGRVGRAKERAYSYLIVPPANAMTDEARARIEALERHTDLGSGFQIASLDLELRGSGDLLGAEQSGTVASVGFELFCQMLDEAVHELRGEPVVHEVDPELSFDADARLPEDYVADIGVRLSLYKRLASAASAEEVQDLASEMEDRFGPPPPEARRFVHLMRLKTDLRKLRALGCEATSRSVTLHLREDAPLDTAKLMKLIGGKHSPYKLSPDMRLTRRTKEGEAFTSGLESADKLLSELQACLTD